MLKSHACCLSVESGCGIRDEITFIESRMMKASIHPAYEVVKVTCSCGQVFETRSTLCRALGIEVCAECHPFYTGQQKLVDTGGRVQKFRDRYKSRIETQKDN